MRATEARFAPLTLGQVVEGDGETKATFRLTGPRGRVDLVLTLDLEAGCLGSVALVPVKVGPARPRLTRARRESRRRRSGQSASVRSGGMASRCAW